MVETMTPPGVAPEETAEIENTGVESAVNEGATSTPEAREAEPLKPYEVWFVSDNPHGFLALTKVYEKSRALSQVQFKTYSAPENAAAELKKKQENGGKIPEAIIVCTDFDRIRAEDKRREQLKLEKKQKYQLRHKLGKPAIAESQIQAPQGESGPNLIETIEALNQSGEHITLVDNRDQHLVVSGDYERAIDDILR